MRITEFKTLRNCCAVLAAFVLVFALPISSRAQSLTSGAIAGNVTDPTGAMVPGATVTAINQGTNAQRSVTASSSGSYIISQLTTGEYKVSAKAEGFKVEEVGPITVNVSQTSTVNFTLELGVATQTVEVSASASLIQTENPNTTTTVSAAAIDSLPNPGNDLSYVAQIAPGAIMNTGGGYGNMEFNGLPATSTNFTVDGLDANDPFLNLNNSGATNLQLGTNAVEEASVNTLSFSVDQGRSGAAQVNFVTKSGTNNWHGNGFEIWNGRVMNSQNWFVNAQPVPNTDPSKKRPFSNVNQFGGSLGGPILKNKLFVFGDLEGLQIVLPATLSESFPSQAFENYVLAQLPLGGFDPRRKLTYAPPPNAAVAVAAYQKEFALYGSPSGGVPVATTNCPILGDGTILPMVPGVRTPHGTGCRLFRTFGLSNKTHDLFTKFRVDQDINQNNRVWYAFEWEKGVQATYTDPVNPVFNAFSTQPQTGLSISYAHIFNSNLVNEFNPGYYWYSAIFQPNSFPKALAASPFEFRGASLTPIFGAIRSWPQGRNVTDWQLIDNLTWTRNTHTFKFGENLRRSLISDHDLGTNIYPYISMGDPIQFAHDILGSLGQLSFVPTTSEPVGIAGLDMYAQDSWKWRSNVTVTYGLRATWNTDPKSQHKDFARLKGSFYDINHDINQPLNSVINPHNSLLFDSTPLIAWQPRASVAWSFRPKTVIRVGGGMFSDIFPAAIADNEFTNFPSKNVFFAGAPSTGLPIVATYAIPGSGNGIAGDPNNDGVGNMTAANAALLAGFGSGVLSCVAANAPPNCISSTGYYAVPKGQMKFPLFTEWRATLEQEFGTSWKVMVSYVGTKATHMPYNVSPNGFQTVCAGCFAPYLFDPTFNGPDGRFGGVTQLAVGANSSYHGLQTSLEKRTARGLTVRLNYTWSHCIDELSNEGAVTGGFDGNSITGATPGQLFNVRGNCDYDVRNSLNGSWVYQLPSPGHNRFLKQILGGWQFSGDIFLHTGFPFSIGSAGYFANGNGVFQGSDPNFAIPNGKNPYAKWQKLPACDPNTGFLPTGPCQTPGVAEVQWLNPSAFTSVVDPSTGSCTAGETFDAQGNVLTTNDTAQTCQYARGGRNNVFGPGYFNTDMFIGKNFSLSERVKLRIDAQFYNAFNHMNLSNPGTGAGIPGVGSTLVDSFTSGGTANPPTSLLGSFLGGDNSVRMIAIKARIEF